MQPYFREKWVTEHATFWVLFGQTSFFFLAGVACNNAFLIFYRTGPKHWWVCFRPVFLVCLTFGVIGRSKSLRRVVNPVYMSSIVAKGAIL
jgi:hypothetical protein